MDILRDTKLLVLIALFAIFGAALAVWGTYSGILLILALVVFGSLSLTWHEKHLKIAALIFIVALSLLNIGVNGVKFGIDFKGGTRIPVVLERPVDQATMSQLVNIIKERASGMSLSEVKVRAVGNTQVDVEIPSSDEGRIKLVEDILSHKGVYLGIVDGQIGVSGEHIFSKTIGPLTQDSLIRSGADWGVSFTVDRVGAETFAKAANGKADYPVYMFLDRPNDAALFYTRSEFRATMYNDSGERESLNALKAALKLDGGKNINVYILDDINFTDANSTAKPYTNKTFALISNSSAALYGQQLTEAGFVVKAVSDNSTKPTYMRSSTGVLILEKLEVAGLLSSPILSPDITTGIPGYHYAITGGVESTDPTVKAQLGRERTQYMESILKGGSLPVEISLGSRTTLPATLGEEFLNLSLIGIALSLIVISLLIGIRYMNIRATLPIVAISLAEFVILIAILGSFTIDLAAVAGILAAIGVGVDAQIVITDELLKKDEHSIEEKTEHAFEIIQTNVIVATLSMLPLLFSKLISGVVVVEILGFAISTILGSLLGYLLSRPAYAVVVEKILDIESKEKK
ncbi:MAG: hypothetical protein V1492_01715 [Candidatus Micrarchaeota archaeon]